MPNKKQKKEKSSRVYVYILECADGSYYTGYTPDLERRVKVHNAGKGAKYTRSRLPVKLVWSDSFKDKQTAMQIEAQIKTLDHTQKIEIIDT